ncbi:hypothetical protein [Photobacterium phosphoreum]|nr:hypothetical protein [Photobacterium phosphoreum]
MATFVVYGRWINLFTDLSISSNGINSNFKKIFKNFFKKQRVANNLALL